MFMKRAQISGQVFLYIFGVIIIGLVIFLGYRFISGTGKASEKYVSSEFQKSLINDINSLTGSPGSTYTKKYTLPAGFDEICFVDTEVVSVGDLGNYPIIQNSVDTGVENNVFLSGKQYFGAFNVKNMQVSNYPFFYCAKSRKGIVEINMLGSGDATIMLIEPYETYCRNAENLDLCNELDFTFETTGYKAGCCSLYTLCCE